MELRNVTTDIAVWYLFLKNKNFADLFNTGSHKIECCTSIVPSDSLSEYRIRSFFQLFIYSNTGSPSQSLAHMLDHSSR